MTQNHPGPLLRGLIVASSLAIASQAEPRIGGGACTSSSLNGVYYYLLSGDLLSGSAYQPYIELGKLVADGNGGVSGNSHASIGGAISAYTLAGTYAVQSNCTGSMTLSANRQTPGSFSFQVLNGGESAIVAFSSQTGVLEGVPRVVEG